MVINRCDSSVADERSADTTTVFMAVTAEVNRLLDGAIRIGPSVRSVTLRCREDFLYSFKNTKRASVDRRDTATGTT